MRATITLAAGLVVLGTVAAADGKPTRPDLQVVLMIDGGLTSPPHFFLLKVEFSGEISGGGDLNPGLPVPPKRLSASAHAELARLIQRERLFERPYRNLPCAVDLGGRSIEAWQGTKLRRVQFCVDDEVVQQAESKLSEAQALLRLWYGVLSVVANGKKMPVHDLDARILAKKLPRRRTRR